MSLCFFHGAVLARNCIRGKASYQAAEHQLWGTQRTRLEWAWLQAPELHTDQEYDAYLTDAFSVGKVVLQIREKFSWRPSGTSCTRRNALCCAVEGRPLSSCDIPGCLITHVEAQDYPWLSTRPGGCKCFEYVKKHGFRACPRRNMRLGV